MVDRLIWSMKTYDVVCAAVCPDLLHSALQPIVLRLSWHKLWLPSALGLMGILHIWLRMTMLC